MKPYAERYPVGTRIRIADRARLEQFRREWLWHNPLTAEQLAFANRDAIVRDVSFYHGGDVLYRVDGAPGIWHEVCLIAADDPNLNDARST